MKIYVPPRIPKRSRPDELKNVIEKLEAAGIKVASTSRIGDIQRLFANGKGRVDPDDPRFERAIESVRDLQSLSFILDQHDLNAADPAFKRLLSSVVKDSDLPQKDRVNSRGRDAVFELHVGGACIAASFDDVRYEEPDITFGLDGVRYGMAAMRVKSEASVSKRVRDGVRQVKKSGLHGVVVLDTALAFNPQNRIFPKPVSDREFITGYRRVLADKWKVLDPILRPLLNHRLVLGLIAHDHMVRQKLDGEWYWQRMSGELFPPDQLDDDKATFERILRFYNMGQPNHFYG
ncbi:hypothetical protein Pla123a_35140 [Posidoniimonas polymericola]|uniref:Uncharacterized protein n=1 Tax=Posidoniimonas polymericola TaxID=2528002 RepID=A0A5C5YIK4_9BACT|nr:hypothetical protein [Posidoniimonas polymericola]TWT74690.1 hypothetical protein Pla123a_35140 [Posidoniimonas polymericola]